MKLSAPIHRMKSDARRLARDERLPLHTALDRIAKREGFPRWSLLVSSLPASAGSIHADLVPGDMLLVGARPGHGKTLMGLKLAVEAMKGGDRAYFFTLEYAVADVLERLRAIGAEPERYADRLVVDTSEDIGADHVIAALGEAPRGTLAVIDYLQLLDQRRDKPALAEQLRRMKAFASRRGVILVFLSQIDRTYDAGAKACPEIGDVRLPNPVDLMLFDRTCFLNQGSVRFSAAV